MTSPSTTHTPNSSSTHPTFEKAARKDLSEAGLNGSSLDSAQLVVGEGLLSGLREPKMLAALVASVLGLALAYSGWTSYRDKQLNEGSDALFKAQKTLSDALLKEARLAAGLPAEAHPQKPETASTEGKKSDAKMSEAEKEAEAKAASQKREQEQAESKKISEQLQKIQYEKFDVQARYGAGVGALKAVAEKYVSLRPGFEARIALGGLYFDHGDLGQALVHYESASKNAPSRLDQGVALNLLAAVYESQGKTAEALAIFEKGVATGEPAVQGEALLGVARTAQLQGNSDRARSALEQIKKQFKDSSIASRAENLLQDIPAKAQPESGKAAQSAESKK
jgi:tetratricopeptide (TPR) repeat protein